MTIPTARTVPDAGLPVPRTGRWQPLRAGVVDLFYYDYQEFWFRDGRLMLRGNNGTGKSKVLALTLPFLLDGDLSPSRVEPDGDRTKKMEWNLLLGGKYDERLGYTWLEFGRRTADGEHAYLTVGCGLKGVTGRGIADRWFFLTSQRVGADLFLIGPSGTVLTRDRLTGAIGDFGHVTQNAGQYRRWIDEHLFHLGIERYEALVNLLIQLRQPQLSKRPDEHRLSAALSEALTPVDQAVLTDVATAFHDLQQQREELEGLRDTRRHVERFLDRYRRYAQIAARRQGRELRSTHAAYEQHGRDLSDVRKVIEEATGQEAQAARALADAQVTLREQQATREELATDPRLKNLADAEQHAELAATGATTAHETMTTAAVVRDDRRERHRAAEVAASQTRGVAGQRAEASAVAAADAGIARRHSDGVAGLALPDGPFPDDALATADRVLRELAGHRREAVSHVRSLAAAAQHDHETLVRERGVRGELDGERDAAGDRVAEADQRVAGAVDQHVAGWRAYAAGAAELSLPDPDKTGLAQWAGTLAGESPAMVALREAGAAAQQALATAHAGAAGRLARQQAVLDELVAERERWEHGELSRPPVPYTREAGVRDGQPGAGLWQVVDFAPDLDAAARAGVEAALEASGLLDARLTPDGQLLDRATHDVVLVGGAPADRNLARVLRPAIDSEDPDAAALSPDAVQTVLASIGFGAGTGAHWVDPQGRWRLGPLHGSWAKPAAEYVGHAAREEARRRRLAELVGEIRAAEQAVESARAEVGAVEARQARLSAELSRHPGDDELRSAHSRLAEARSELARAEQWAERQTVRVAEAERGAAESARARDEAASDLGLPTGLGDLDEVDQAVTDYRTASVELLAALRRHADKVTDLHTWREELARAEEALGQAQERWRKAEDAARAARARLATLQDSLQATVEQLKERLAEVKQRIGELERETGRLDGVHRDAYGRRREAEGRERQLAADLADAQRRRDRAAEVFRQFAATGLLAIACEVEVPDPVTAWAAGPAVRLAREAEQQLAEVDDGDEAWRKIQDDISRRQQELNEALSRHGHHVLSGVDEGWLTVRIQFQGRERGLAELAELLVEEVEYRGRMLTAKERELLEEHLINDVATHLQELIGEAEAQVSQLNAELADRPTSTGMRLRLRWDPAPDGPPGLAEARSRLLRQDADLWSPADRSAVGEFLQRQIEQARTANEHGTWQDHLRQALDYRAWHRFTIERYQDGRWRSATGPASGGERVLTVTLPLFAAVAAHYRSADVDAPRLVTLDEAFAGVDDDARAKCLGLLATFDLDVVMTSEREWGFYATVSGIATHQLVRRDGVDAVHVTTWEWDGATPHRVQRAFRGQAPAGGGDSGPSGQVAGDGTGGELW